MLSVKTLDCQAEGTLETHFGFEEGPTGVLRRRLWVYRPAGFRRGGPVVFFLDGQNAFGERGWRAERAADRCPVKCLLVGVSNSSRRYPEYIGWSQEDGHTDPVAERHADYLVDTVVPYIQDVYRTGKRRALAGASAGGVAALYTGWTRPKVFSTIGSFSAGRHYYDELLERFPEKPPFRLYLSCGDQGLDREFRPQTAEFARHLKARGTEMRLRLHKGSHHETTWARRIPDFLNFFTAPFAPARDSY